MICLIQEALKILKISLLLFIYLSIPTCLKILLFAISIYNIMVTILIYQLIFWGILRLIKIIPKIIKPENSFPEKKTVLFYSRNVETAVNLAPLKIRIGSYFYKVCTLIKTSLICVWFDGVSPKKGNAAIPFSRIFKVKKD